ncbi:MAG: type IV pilin protein [Elusimicrobiota bacterium]
MKKNMESTVKQADEGFTLIELLVVILIIGILAAIAVPQYFKVIEKSRAAEAPATFDTIRGAEERYMAQNSSYYNGALNSGCTMDICPGGSYPNLSNFVPGSITANSNGWSLSLTRNAPPAGFGQYTLTYTVVLGGTTGLSMTGCSDANCCADLGLSSALSNSTCY